jgi:predicted nucleic acid-binding protein
MRGAVLDPRVLVSALVGRPDTGPGQLVAAWRAQRFVMVGSPQRLAQLGDVLARTTFERCAREERASA